MNGILPLYIMPQTYSQSHICIGKGSTTNEEFLSLVKLFLMFTLAMLAPGRDCRRCRKVDESIIYDITFQIGFHVVSSIF
jgi:hypothetical protein